MREASKTEALLYAIQILKYFQARSGKPGTMTLDEWSCIQQWREECLDIEAILRGIDLAFIESAGDVSSLLHCAKAVKEAAKLPS
jgi:hypothetical protein